MQSVSPLKSTTSYTPSEQPCGGKEKEMSNTKIATATDSLTVTLHCRIIATTYTLLVSQLILMYNNVTDINNEKRDAKKNVGKALIIDALESNLLLK